MAIDFSQLPPPTSNFPARNTPARSQLPLNEARKNLTYKTKEIKFRNLNKQIVLQNENGPCPLIAICNVLLLRNEMYLYPDRFQVSQERLLSLVADLLLDSDHDDVDDEYSKNQQHKIADAINLLPSFADGINVNTKFRRIDDFEFTPELAIFDLLEIPLYHGWIVDPQDLETAIAIGCKSYNDLMTALVTLETQTESSKKARSFADSTPTSAEHSKLKRGDIEEERLLLRALRLSEREKLGIDTRRDSGSGGESASGYSDAYLMSESDSLVDSMEAESPCASTPGSGNTCQKSRCDDQVSSKESGGETVCVVGDKFSMGEDVCSTTSGTKITGALDNDHLSSTPLGDEMLCDVETENISKITDALVTLKKANLESTKDDTKTTCLNVPSSDIIDSSSENSLKSKTETFFNLDVSGRSQDDGQFSSKEIKDVTDCDVGNKMNVGEESHATTLITKSGALHSDQLSSKGLGGETACDAETENSSKMTDVHVTMEKTNLELTKNNSSSKIQFKSEAVTFVNPDLTKRSQDDVTLYEAEKCVSLGSPVYKGESILGQSSSEGKDTNGLTPRQGDVIKNFLNSNASQLTFPGLFFLEQGLEEGELCVFFRNNHFYTMLKYDDALYNLVTDQGYLNERDLVWEKLDEVNGDSVFVNGDFKVFKCESGNWDQQNVLSNTADYINSIISASKEGMEVGPDLKMAMELQEQELGEDDLEVSVTKQSHVFVFNTRSEGSNPRMVQRWHVYNMYNHVYKFSSFLCKVELLLFFH